MDSTTTTQEHGNELYASLSPELIGVLRQYECQVTMNPGTHLIRHEENPDRLVIIRSGEVLLSLACQGTSIELGKAGPGKVLGLRPMISGELPEIDALCVRECRVALISKTHFMDVLKNHPRLYFAIAKVLSADLKIAEHYLKSSSRRRMRGPRMSNC